MSQGRKEFSKISEAESALVCFLESLTKEKVDDKQSQWERVHH